MRSFIFAVLTAIIIYLCYQHIPTTYTWKLIIAIGVIVLADIIYKKLDEYGVFTPKKKEQPPTPSMAREWHISDEIKEQAKKDVAKARAKRAVRIIQENQNKKKTNATAYTQKPQPSVKASVATTELIQQMQKRHILRDSLSQQELAMLTMMISSASTPMYASRAGVFSSPSEAAGAEALMDMQDFTDEMNMQNILQNLENNPDMVRMLTDSPDILDTITEAADSTMHDMATQMGMANDLMGIAHNDMNTHIDMQSDFMNHNAFDTGCSNMDSSQSMHDCGGGMC